MHSRHACCSLAFFAAAGFVSVLYFGSTVGLPSQFMVQWADMQYSGILSTFLGPSAVVEESSHLVSAEYSTLTSPTQDTMGSFCGWDNKSCHAFLAWTG